jgi:hypothetical protein
LRLEAISVGPVEPVERVGAVLVTLSASGPKVGNDPVLVIVAVDLLEPVAGQVDLDLDRIGERIAPIAFPLSAGNGGEAPRHQAQAALLQLRENGIVEAANGALEYLV